MCAEVLRRLGSWQAGAACQACDMRQTSSLRGECTAAALRRGQQQSRRPRSAAPQASQGGKRDVAPSAVSTPTPATAPLRGADFIRPHLRVMAPYTPIEPFDILSERLGRHPKDIVKLDANENPYGPPPGVHLTSCSPCLLGELPS